MLSTLINPAPTKLTWTLTTPTYLPIELYAEADQATLVRVSKRVDKEPIWLSSLATWLRSLADMEEEVKAMRAELDERNRLQIAMLNEFKRKQEEEIAAYFKVIIPSVFSLQ